MKQFIPRPFIDQLLGRADIYELIDSRVKLKKAGRDYQACCPFHHEKTPSFTVSRNKQFYHCFGCGAHGNALSFLMDYENLEFVEAVEELAGIYGMEVPYEQRISQNGQAISNSNNNQNLNYQSKRDLYQLMEEITHYYQDNLQHSIPAQTYLSQRGLTKEIISRFGIGFALNDMSGVLNKFAINSEQRKQLFTLGMLSSNERSNGYDRFRHRIMFPIRDRRGRVIAFGGRVLGDEKPKYLNSPETAVYHKGNELYGLYEAQQINSKPESLLVVEGYMDVVALAQFGIDNAVAALGTATTPEQIRQLFRVSEKVICCYDGDRAGRDAAWRAFENGLPYLQDGRQLKFLFLPDGEDPDSYIRKIGKNAFLDKLDNATQLSEFMFNNLLQDVDLSTPEGRAKLSHLAIPLIEQIPGETLKLYLREALGKRIGVLDPLKLDELFKATKAKSGSNFANQAANNQRAPVSPVKMKKTPLRLLIALLLQKPSLVHLISEHDPELLSIRGLNVPGSELLYQLAKLSLDNEGITTGQLVEYWRGRDEYSALEKLAMWNHLIEEENFEDTFAYNLDIIYAQVIEQHINKLIAKERESSLTPQEKQELMKLLQKG